MFHDIFSHKYSLRFLTISMLICDPFSSLSILPAPMPNLKPQGELIRGDCSGSTPQEGPVVLPMRDFSPLPHHPLTANESLYQASGGCPHLIEAIVFGKYMKDYHVSLCEATDSRFFLFWVNASLVSGGLVCMSNFKFSGFQMFFPFQSLLITKLSRR